MDSTDYNFVKADKASDSSLKCLVPYTNKSENEYQMAVLIGTNQYNLIKVGFVNIKQLIQVHRVSLKFLQR